MTRWLRRGRLVQGQWVSLETAKVPFQLHRLSIGGKGLSLYCWAVGPTFSVQHLTHPASARDKTQNSISLLPPHGDVARKTPPTRNPDEGFAKWVGTSSRFFDRWIPYLGPVPLFSNSSKIHLVKAMVFSVVMYGCESWTIKKAECRRIDAFELWCWRRLLSVCLAARRSNQSILKEVSPGCSLEGLMLKLKLQYFGHLI